MQRNDIGFFKKLHERNGLHADVDRALFREKVVVADERRFKTLKPFRKQPPDIAEPDDADGFLRQFPPHKFLFLPTPRTRRNIRGNEVAETRQHHRDDFLGNAVCVRARRIHYVDVFFARVDNIDIVETCSRANYQAQFRERINNLRRDFFAADDDNVCVRVRGGKLRKRRFRVLDNFVALRRKRFRRDTVEFGRNENLLHDAQMQSRFLRRDNKNSGNGFFADGEKTLKS